MINSRKIFLTGERDVGKTTIITKFLKETKLNVGGFNTVIGGLSLDEECDYVYIIPYGEELDVNQSKPVASRAINVHNITTFPEIFDTEGKRILSESKDTELIIMDELGFMESEALEFQQEVLSFLDSNLPVLGVIKPKKNVFLDSVRDHDAVEIIEVTEDNRNEICSTLQKIFLE